MNRVGLEYQEEANETFPNLLHCLMIDFCFNSTDNLDAFQL